MGRRLNPKKRAGDADVTVNNETVPPTTTGEIRDSETNVTPVNTNEIEATGPHDSPSKSPTKETTKPTNGAIADSDASDHVSEHSDAGMNGENGIESWRIGQDDDDEEEEDEDEEEILVVLELADFKNHPILDDYKSITIEGIDTPKPTLHIGEYSLHGQLEETVGTHYFYDTKHRTDDNEYQYVGQTTKKIKFTIAPPDEY